MISNFLTKRKDGGPESQVDTYFLIEIKWLFTIALLKFNKGRREAYHTHAFNAWTWFLSGSLIEERLHEIEGELWPTYNEYRKSFRPKFTTKDNLHRVRAFTASWCLTLRGPWEKTWTEYNAEGRTTTFTHGRRIL